MSNSPKTDPSGVPIPTGNIPGWTLVYSQDFNGNSLPSGWGAYSGQPGGTSDGYWNRANVTVSDGELHFRTTADDDPLRSNTYSTGGVNFYGHPQTYGMYLVRLKGDYEPGLEISDIALLWPSSSNNVWPPEIDFFEDSGGTRGAFSTTLHPGPNGDDCCIVNATLDNNATQWHTYGVEWTSTTISYTIDGHQWGNVIHKSQLSPPAQWPNINMDLDLQSENLGPAQPARPIETMTVDWVVEYTPSP
jgi:beta-glucanase (GH16 family)